MEILRPNPAPGRLRHVVFDFDGTLSLIREGWQLVMQAMMVEILRATAPAAHETELPAVVMEPIVRLAGKPTVDQMRWLAEEVAKGGGRPLTPGDYKQQYLGRLEEHIRGRLGDLRTGRVPPATWLVPGSKQFLERVRERGVTCYLASGTDEDRVRDEAMLLGLAPFFVEICGARPDGSFSKRMLLGRIVAEHHLTDGELAVFGDGRVEIEDAKAVGGIAIGVASNEREWRGVDEDKRAQLIEAGADAIIPDFRSPAALLAYFWPELL